MERGEIGKGGRAHFNLRVVLPAGHADCYYQDLLRACVSPCVCAGCERRREENKVSGGWGGVVL